MVDFNKQKNSEPTRLKGSFWHLFYDGAFLASPRFTDNQSATAAEKNPENSPRKQVLPSPLGALTQIVSDQSNLVSILAMGAEFVSHLSKFNPLEKSF